MRDYANKGRHSGSQAAPRKRPAGKKSRKRPTAGGRAAAIQKHHGWKYLLVGLLISLFVAMIIQLDKQRIKQRDNKPSGSTVEQPAKPGKQTKKPTEKEESPDTPPVEYEFFELLPNAKVTKPNVGVPRAPSSLDGEAGAPLPFGQYLLQAGSFRTARDAEARRAELTLLAVEAEVVPVELKDGETWHRVRLGPYTDRKQLMSVRQKLTQANIEFIIYKQKE